MLPKSDIKADTCDLDGATYTRESGEPARVITCSLKDTVSGWIGDGDSTSEKKQHNLRESPSRTVAKKRTALFIDYLLKKRSGVSSPR